MQLGVLRGVHVRSVSVGNMVGGGQKDWTEIVAASEQ